MYQRYRQLLPLLLLLVFCISTITQALIGTVELDGVAYGFALNAKHYGAIALTAVAVASFFLMRKCYKYSLLLIFSLGLFGLLTFTAGETSLSLFIGPIQLAILPVLLLFGLLLYLLNHQKINASLFALIKPSEERLARVRLEEVEEFKTRFARKTTAELA
jgi:hypothetical protein